MNRLLFLLPVLFITCNTQPKTVNRGLQAGEELTATERPAEKPAAEKPADGRLNPVAAADAQKPVGLKEESYDQVFHEVKAFIENLNTVIQSRNYAKWREALSEERLKEISSPVFLASVSNMNSMKRRGIVLKTVNDYFFNVVVPSRASSHVDKIEIMDNNRVKVFYMQTRKVEGHEERTETVPLLVYELERDGNSWKIIR